MYRNSLTPSKLFGIALLLPGISGSLIWGIGFADTAESTVFDFGSLVVLALSVGLLVLSFLFLRRVRVVRILTSILLHLAALALLATLPFTVAAAETTLDKMIPVILTLLGVGLLFLAILVLHSDAMQSDFAISRERIRHRKRFYLAAVAGCVLLLTAAAAWLIVPLLVAHPTITVDYLAQANQISKPADYDPNRNAALYYERLFTQFSPLPDALQSGDQWKSWPTDLDPDERRALDEWTTVNEFALPILANAARCPYWWPELKSDSGALSSVRTSHPEEYRNCAWGIALWAKYKASQGNVAEAMQLLADLHLMGVQRIQVGRVNDQLVGAAICRVCGDGVLAILCRCTAAKDVLERNFHLFTERLPQTHVPRFCEVEDLHARDSIQLMFTNDGHDNGRLIPKQLYLFTKNHVTLFPRAIPYLDALRICLSHPDRGDTLLLHEMYFAFVTDLSQRTPWDLYVKNTSYEERLKDLLSGNYYLLDTSVSVSECIRVGWRDRVADEAMVAILAIFAHRAHEGRLPQYLRQLVDKGLLPSVPMDPYSGAPLIYRVKDDNFTLYSVGEDFVDDGGVHCEWNDPSGGDHVFWPVPASSP